MSKFKSENFSRVICEDCGSITTIEPGRVFAKLECVCNVEKSKQFKKILVYTDNENFVELLGEFKNGDKEVKHVDGTLSYRIPKDTFDKNYKEVTNDEAIETAPTNEKEDSVSKGSDPLGTFSISLSDLEGLSTQEIKDLFNMDELRVLAKSLKIKNASITGEDKLIEKLLQKV